MLRDYISDDQFTDWLLRLRDYISDDQFIDRFLRLCDYISNYQLTDWLLRLHDYISDDLVTGRGCSTKKSSYQECETHSYGEVTEKFCYCTQERNICE